MLQSLLLLTQLTRVEREAGADPGAEELKFPVVTANLPLINCVAGV